MNGMMDLLAGGKLSVGNCLVLMVMLLPSMVSYALPFGFVTATLLTVGGMATDREFIALKGSGVSPLKIFSSILFLASLGVLLSLVVNFHYAPRAISKVKSKIQNIIREEPLRFVTPKKFIREFPGYIIFVKDLDQNRLQDFHIWELDEQEKVASYIYARSGTLTYDIGKQALILTLLQGTVEKVLKEGKYMPLISFEQFSLDLPLKDILRKTQIRKKIRHMTLAEMITLLERSKQEGDLEKQMEVQVNMQTQCAMAFSIISLVLITLPLSARWHHKGASLNTVIALLVCIIYYFIMMILSFLSKRPEWYPNLIIWLPNIILQILGIWQWRRMNRH
jgi:lipopolysaccharide export system permease protein